MLVSLWILILQFKPLRVRVRKEPCIGLTQENLIENSIQDCESYILKPHGPCYFTLAYSK